MTNSEYREKFPIGTKIRWVLKKRFANNFAREDIGKVGEIVGYDKRDCPFVYLPESKHFSFISTQAIPVSWCSSWKNLEILSQKNKQLLFSFMQ